jgi:hypothetical protein
VIPFVEKEVGAYLRTHPDVVALQANVSTATPRKFEKPWVRMTLLDAPSTPNSTADHLINHLIQFDCYASSIEDGAAVEANLLARSVRAALHQMPGVHNGVTVSSVRFVGMLHLPDADLEPARERYILTAEVIAHG